MCGILGFLGNAESLPEELAACLASCLSALRPRGPEYQTLTYPAPNIALGFTRLAINGLTEAGHQPVCRGAWTVVCNGEIYNWRDLVTRYDLAIPEGASDCAVIPALLEKLGDPTLVCRALDGVFAFIAVHEGGDVLVARDPYGVRPLFQSNGSEGYAWASELKAIPFLPTLPTSSVAPFPPGTWRCFSGDQLKEVRYHSVPWVRDPFARPSALRKNLEAAVDKRLMSDRPVGALLSGGLDSSLVAAIAARRLAERGQKLHTFSIGMPGSTDLGYARLVADHIGTVHHEIQLTREDFLGAIEEVVGVIESYDVTTVRASVGNWLIGKWIRDNTDIKVVLNGDGSDEVGGGYLYFYRAPSDAAFEAESERLLADIHMYDVLRSDRCISAHGLEPRTPFLDKQVVAAWRSFPTELRRPTAQRMEKALLREAFEPTTYLPAAVLWRKKEAFSDGVSSTEESWYQIVGNRAAEQGTTEATWYRSLFEARYGPAASACIPYMWMPRWIEGVTDPSARVLKELYPGDAPTVS